MSLGYHFTEYEGKMLLDPQGGDNFWQHRSAVNWERSLLLTEFLLCWL